MLLATAWRHGVDEAALGSSGSPRRASAEGSGGAYGDARTEGEHRRNRRVAAYGGANEVSGILAGRAEEAGEKPQHVAWQLHDRGCSPLPYSGGRHEIRRMWPRPNAMPSLG